MPRIAILDDYQNVAKSFGDWTRLDLMVKILGRGFCRYNREFDLR
jgi:hypothetical protein